MSSIIKSLGLGCLISPFRNFRARWKTTNESKEYLDGTPITGEKETVIITKYSEISTSNLASASTINEQRTQKALVVVSKRTYALIDSHPVPEFQNQNEVMIRNYAVGLNPIDWKSVDYNFCLPEFPWVTGREMAGVVEKVASGVTQFKPGDRVWTSTYYRDSRAGCFQELVTVPQHTVCAIPSNLNFESAACLGVAALTASMTLWKWLNVPMKSSSIPKPASNDTEYLLIWGGSTVTGQFAIQIAVRAGLNVIAVTSEKTKYLTQELGAQVVTRDGKTNEEIVADIRAIGGDHITRVIDLVGTTTAAVALRAASTSKPVVCAPLAMMASNQIIPGHVTVETVEMKRFVLDETSRVYSNELNRLVECGFIKLPEIEVMKGGLSVVEEGLNRVKRGDMNGKKVVVSL